MAASPLPSHGSHLKLVFGAVMFLTISPSLLYLFLLAEKHVLKTSLRLGKLNGKYYIPVFRREFLKGNSCFPQSFLYQVATLVIGNRKSSCHKNRLQELAFTHQKIGQAYIHQTSLCSPRLAKIFTKKYLFNSQSFEVDAPNFWFDHLIFTILFPCH